MNNKKLWNDKGGSGNKKAHYTYFDDKIYFVANIIMINIIMQLKNSI